LIKIDPIDVKFKRGTKIIIMLFSVYRQWTNALFACMKGTFTVKFTVYFLAENKKSFQTDAWKE